MQIVVTIVSLLLRMLEALEKEPSVYQTLFEKAPELIALLAVFLDTLIGRYERHIKRKRRLP